MKKFFGKIGNFFKKIYQSIHGYFCRRYAGLKTLVVMQLKDKLNFSFNADKKGALTKLILRFILFAVVTAIIAAVFFLSKFLAIFGKAADVPISVFNFFFITMTLLSTISCIASLTNSLYFSKDNLVLLSYPVRPNIVFLSKLVVYYILELLKSITYIIPMFLAYGIIFGFKFGYYPWLLFMFFVISAVPVAIASIVSIPYMYIKMFLMKRPLLQDMFFVALLITGTVFAFIIINSIPENLHFLLDWGDKYRPLLIGVANNYEIWFTPFYYLSALTIGATQAIDSPSLIHHVFSSQSWYVLLIVLGSITLLFFLAYVIAKPLFFKIAVKPFEYNKKVIFHNFSRAKSKIKSTKYEEALAPVLEGKLSRKDKYDLRFKFEKALNELVKEGDLFYDKKVNIKRIRKQLEKILGIKFEIVNIEQLMNDYPMGFFIETRNDMPFLVLAESIGVASVNCYDPNYLKKQNFEKTAFFSTIWKDVVMDLRTPGSLVSNYILFMVSPLALALLNKLFASINTNFLGVSLTIMFNVLIITLIPLSSNVTFASIYSREGESSYLLKAAPANYMKMLTAKLVIRAILMTFSILTTCIIYRFYASEMTQAFIKPLWLFVGVAGIYLGHLLWSAELDFMNPQDALYREVGEGNISNPNENLSMILSYVITVLFTLFTFLMFQDNAMYAFYKIALVGAFFLASRILLFTMRIKGYRNSRGERGRD